MGRKRLERVILECFNCKEMFEKAPWLQKTSENRKTKKIFCSMSCYAEDRKVNHGPRWMGGRSKSNGYVQIWSKEGTRRLEHRDVMEKHLKRDLEEGEVVHHINGIRDDNRIENLVVCQSSGKHTKEFHPSHRENGKFKEYERG